MSNHHRCAMDGIKRKDGDILCKVCRKIVNYNLKIELDKIENEPLTQTVISSTKQSEERQRKNVDAAFLKSDISEICGRNKALAIRLRLVGIKKIKDIIKLTRTDLDNRNIKQGEIPHIIRRLKEKGLMLKSV